MNVEVYIWLTMVLVIMTACMVERIKYTVAPLKAELDRLHAKVDRLLPEEDEFIEHTTGKPHKYKVNP